MRLFIREYFFFAVLAATCLSSVNVAADDTQLVLGDSLLNVNLVQGDLTVTVNDSNDDKKLVLNKLLINYQQANRWEIRKSSSRAIAYFCQL